MIVPILLGLGVLGLVWSTRRAPVAEMPLIHTYPIRPGDTVEIGDNVIVTDRQFLDSLQKLLELPEIISEIEIRVNSISRNSTLMGFLERYNTTKPASRFTVHEVPTRFVEKRISGGNVYVL